MGTEGEWELDSQLLRLRELQAMSARGQAASRAIQRGGLWGPMGAPHPLLVPALASVPLLVARATSAVIAARVGASGVEAGYAVGQSGEALLAHALALGGDLFEDSLIMQASVQPRDWISLLAHDALVLLARSAISSSSSSSSSLSLRRGGLGTTSNEVGGPQGLCLVDLIGCESDTDDATESGRREQTEAACVDMWRLLGWALAEAAQLVSVNDGAATRLVRECACAWVYKRASESEGDCSGPSSPRVGLGAGLGQRGVDALLVGLACGCLTIVTKKALLSAYVGGDGDYSTRTVSATAAVAATRGRLPAPPSSVSSAHWSMACGAVRALAASMSLVSVCPTGRDTSLGDGAGCHEVIATELKRVLPPAMANLAVLHLRACT